MNTSSRTMADELYAKLTNEEDSRLCEDIDEKACRASPRSFVLILCSYFLTKLGDAIASPKTTLAWVCNTLGAPAFVIGFLVPIRESGSMLPQLFIGSYVRGLALRKWVWVLGSAVQAAAVVGIGLVALYLDGRAAGWGLLILVVVFSLARGFCSIAAKDVIGKTVAKPSRGQLTGWSASLAGGVTIVVGLVLMSFTASDAERFLLGALLIGAGLLWLIGAGIYARVPEYEGATDGGRNVLDALKRLRLLADDRPFRHFVITRALMMCSALSAPFYVALAQSELGSPAWLLGAFVATSGLASLVSAPVWGRFADVSSKKVMILAAVVTSGIGLLTFALHQVAPGVTGSIWFLPFAYFVLSIAHSGVRVGRKTYVVNLGTGNRRTDYVAIGNSAIGLLLLIAGSVGALAPIIGQAGVIAVLAGMGLLGAVSGLRLPDV
jgi:hypothetical protein